MNEITFKAGNAHSVNEITFKAGNAHNVGDILFVNSARMVVAEVLSDGRIILVPDPSARMVVAKVLSDYYYNRYFA